MEISGNRVTEELLKWKQRDEVHSSILTAGARNSPHYAREKLRQLDLITAKIGKPKNEAEHISLKVLSIQRKELLDNGYKNWFSRIAYLLMRPIKANLQTIRFAKTEKQKIKDFKQSMETAGLTKFTDKAMDLIGKGQKNFSFPVAYKNDEKESVDFKLNINHNEEEGHKLESYNATYTDKMSPGVIRQHKIIVETDTLPPEKIANLIAGRSSLDGKVENGIIKQTWTQFDLTDKDAQGSFRVKQISTNNFDMEKTCETLPFWQQLSAMERLSIVLGLFRGDRHQLSLNVFGEPVIISLQMDPGKQSILAFNQQGKLTNLEKMFLSRDHSKQPSLAVGDVGNNIIKDKQVKPEEEQKPVEKAVKNREKLRVSHKQH